MGPRARTAMEAPVRPREKTQFPDVKEPYHPADPRLRADVRGDAQHWERFESKWPVKYYFIDFDQSVRFANADAIRPVERDKGQVVQAPELHKPPYDAFQLDVFCLGHVIITHVLNAYENVEFVRPIVVDMLHPDPAQRPTAQQVVSRFAEIRRTLFRPELEASPEFIPSYSWFTYYVGETPAREPPLMRRASFSGTQSQDLKPHFHRTLALGQHCSDALSLTL